MRMCKHAYVRTHTHTHTYMRVCIAHTNVQTHTHTHSPLSSPPPTHTHKLHILHNKACWLYGNIHRTDTHTYKHTHTHTHTHTYTHKPVSQHYTLSSFNSENWHPLESIDLYCKLRSLNSFIMVTTYPFTWNMNYILSLVYFVKYI